MAASSRRGSSRDSSARNGQAYSGKTKPLHLRFPSKAEREEWRARLVEMLGEPGADATEADDEGEETPNSAGMARARTASVSAQI